MEEELAAEAGDSTRFQFKLGDRVRNRNTGSIFTVSKPLADWSEFYYERVEAGDSTTPSELQVAPSLEVGDSTADETADDASKRGQAILQEEVHGHRHDGNGIAEACMECREWAEDMVHALAFCGLVIAPPDARPASSVRDTAEAGAPTKPGSRLERGSDAPSQVGVRDTAETAERFTCPGLSMPQPADAPPEGYVACYRAGHTCTSTVTRTDTEHGGVATRVHCPCCGDLHSLMIVPAGMSEGGAE
jgi:hypothetical protein